MSYEYDEIYRSLISMYNDIKHYITVILLITAATTIS
jgi:hypothetical protein